MKTRKVVMVRCCNGHWFCGIACPRDGYSDKFVARVLAAEEAIRSRGDELNFGAIKEQADLTDEEAMTRLMVIEAAESINLRCLQSPYE